MSADWSAPDTSPRWIELRRALLAWFEASGRHIPARETRDPWRLLVLEVMSQQTQIERAAAACEAFCSRFPSATALAAAAPADAVRAWSGLGYNRRAVALWRAAVEIVDHHGGQVPATVEELDTLPGIGPYTARAVASHAFGVPVAPVDVNVARVVGRITGQTRTASVQAAADALVDAPKPSRTVRALMDLAVAVCTRRAPRCPACPVASWCASAFVASDMPASSQRGRPFRTSTRWLRGSLVRELVSAPGGTWVDFDGRTLGSHEPHAVREALATLAADGLIELDPPARARLSTGPSDDPAM